MTGTTWMLIVILAGILLILIRQQKNFNKSLLVQKKVSETMSLEIGKLLKEFRSEITKELQLHLRTQREFLQTLKDLDQELKDLSKKDKQAHEQLNLNLKTLQNNITEHTKIINKLANDTNRRS